jgi:hypothetical protein
MKKTHIQALTGRSRGALDLSLHAELVLLDQRRRDLLAALTRRLQRGTFHSLVDLQAAINRYLDEQN